MLRALTNLPLLVTLGGCHAIFGYAAGDGGGAAPADAGARDGAADGTADASALSACAVAAPGAGVIAGLVFEDVDFAGGAGGPMGGADRGLPGVLVQLYRDGVRTAHTITDAAGRYRFADQAPGRYQVRVVAATIGDADTPPAGGWRAGPAPAIAEQTYECDGVRGNGGAGAMGGATPMIADGPEEGEPREHAVDVALGPAGVGGVSFGFSFELVLNTNDAGQGSLRAFIANANAVARPLRTRFQIPDGVFLGLPRDKNLDRQAAIKPETPLPPLLAAGVELDGTTQTEAVGDTEPLGPEVRIDGDRVPPGSNGLVLRGVGQRVRALELRDFVGPQGTAILLGGVAGATIRGNTLKNCGDAAGGADGALRVLDGTDIAIEANHFVDNPRDGIHVERAAGGISIANNTLERCGDDGIQLVDTVGTVVEDNRIGDSGGAGIETHRTATLLLRGNQIVGSGAAAVETNGGVAVVEGNLLAESAVGVLVRANPHGTALITRNAIRANRQLGIDLEEGGDPDAGVPPARGVTLNDAGDEDTGPNALLNFPVLAAAELLADGTLTVAGRSMPGLSIECFRTDRPADASGYGEGEAFLGAGVEGSVDDADPVVSAAPEAPHNFAFTFPPAAIKAGDQVSCTASDGAQTSEFSLNVAVTASP